MNIIPVEHMGLRVITTNDLASSMGTDTKIISKNFERNEHRYQVGKHYFILQGEELRIFKASRHIDDNLKYAPVIYLWTEKGAWMHAKSLNTDAAWEAYESLVDDYYRIKSPSVVVDQLSPQLQLLIKMEQGIREIELRQDHAEQQLSIIKETFLSRDEDWRNKINGLLNGATRRLGKSYRDMRTLSYQMLEDRARCKLDRRLTFLKDRLRESGATKTKVEDANRLDIIEADPKLKEIYTTIVKELSIGAMN